jgi:hypothetical protein
MFRERERFTDPKKLKRLIWTLLYRCFEKNSKGSFLVWCLLKFENIKSQNADKSLANADKKAATE